MQALRRTGAAEIEVARFAPGGPAAYLREAASLAYTHRAHRPGGRRRAPYDVVHAHYGLTAWPALVVPAAVHAVTLHGTDLVHPRSRAISLAATRRLDLVAAVSAPLAATIPVGAAHAPVAILPCGVDLHRNRRIDRREARRALGLPPDRPCLLFPADPARTEKRFDRALQLAGDIPLLTLLDVKPEEVALRINAANAVLVPSEREGFGLATLEALACDVPVLATPVGVAPAALDGIPGALCAPYDHAGWADALAPHLTDPDPRIDGRARAERWSSDVMALRVIDAWRAALDAPLNAA